MAWVGCANARAFRDVDFGAGRCNSDRGTGAVVQGAVRVDVANLAGSIDLREYLVLFIVDVHSLIETTNPRVGLKVRFCSVILSVTDGGVLAVVMG